MDRDQLVDLPEHYEVGNSKEDKALLSDLIYTECMCPNCLSEDSAVRLNFNTKDGLDTCLAEKADYNEGTKNYSPKKANKEDMIYLLKQTKNHYTYE